MNKKKKKKEIAFQAQQPQIRIIGHKNPEGFCFLHRWGWGAYRGIISSDGGILMS
jgi:hypothetical protein